MDSDSSESDLLGVPFHDSLLRDDSEIDPKLKHTSSRITKPTIINKFLRPFQTCCISYKSYSKKNPDNIDILAVDHISISDSDTSTEDVKTPAFNIFDTYKNELPIEKQNRKLLESHGFVYSELFSSKDIDCGTFWNVTVSLQELFARTDYESLKYCDYPFICFNWCHAVEIGQRTDMEIIIDAIASTKPIESPKGYIKHMQQLLRKAQSNKTIRDLEETESRLIQEIAGQIYKLVDFAKKNPIYCVYMIVSHARSVAVSCFSQNDFLSLRIFDTGVTKERGPALLGFHTPKDLENYLIEIYDRDINVAEMNKYFHTWTFLTESGTRSPPIEQYNYGAVSQKSSSLFDEDPVMGGLQIITNATNTNTKNELLFTQSAAGNLKVSKNPKK